MFTSASTFFSRLTEVEKAAIRGAATPDRLDWLFYARHRFELAGSEAAARKTFDSAVKLINESFAQTSQSDQFGRTWAF